MALIALASAKGSPGVTTCSLAMTLTAARPCVLAECDPAGGDLLAGYLQGCYPADRGLSKLAVAEHRDRLAQDWWQQLLDLDPAHPRTRLLLPGITDPQQAASLGPVWQRLTALFVGLEHQHESGGFDVIADCGRLAAPHVPWPVLHKADMVLLVVRPDMPSLRAAAVRVDMLRSELVSRGSGDDALALLTVGDGPYTAEEIARSLGLPVIVDFPSDKATAQVLSFGGRFSRKAKLLRAARSASERLDVMIRARRARAALTRPPANPSTEAVRMSSHAVR